MMIYVKHRQFLLPGSVAAFAIFLVVSTGTTSAIMSIRVVAQPIPLTSTTKHQGPSSLDPSPTTRVFNLYNTHVLGFNETKGIKKAYLTSDQYSLQTILVNQGDRVVVNLYNMEASTGDRHSFTIDAPYNVNIDVAPGQNGTAAFLANHVGIFKFYCKYHIPSMVGELMVSPSV
jgi:heme/copper-type cytochrome/quinol oxidase subunit 2